MSKFVYIIGANARETFWFSSICNALDRQICHIFKPFEADRKISVKWLKGGLNRGIHPAFQERIAFI